MTTILMPNLFNRGFWIGLCLAITVVPFPLHGQDVIKILSPQNGTIIPAGEVALFKVELKAGPNFKIISLYSQEFGISQAQNKPPYVFRVQAPSSYTGWSKFIAIAANPKGGAVVSEPVE